MGSDPHQLVNLIVHRLTFLFKHMKEQHENTLLLALLFAIPISIAFGLKLFFDPDPIYSVYATLFWWQFSTTILLIHQNGILSRHKMMLAQLTEQYSTINSATSLRSVKKMASTLIETTTRPLPTLASAALLQENSYTNQIEQLIEQALIDATEESSETLWEDVLLMTDKKVYINKSNDNCVKLVGTLNGTAAAAFDLFYDICEQPLWATISDETDIVQVLDPYTRIIYCKLKALWPTTSRDIVFISHIREVRSGTFLQVSQSIEYPAIPVRDGIIRMKLNRVVQQFTVTLPSDKCSFVQIIDVDPGGWIPKSLIRFLATKALPGAIEQINTSLENCPLLIESEAMAFANRGGPASMALPLTPQLTWEEEISSALQALELKVTGIESKIDFLYSRASTSNSQNTPWWYLTTLHRGIHTMSPYLIAGYIAMQLLGRLKK